MLSKQTIIGEIEEFYTNPYMLGMALIQPKINTLGIIFIIGHHNVLTA